ncbi:hypothetical protein GGS26DRAFT_545341 [Hypomontagnella submonticulosa]|nr:hypothetical protein GGS26DRAFT_545341 [Hypomontagnella submonticulosa]
MVLQSEPLQQNRIKSRTSAPKVRTGCITCKRRHVKCDEEKPHCSNCIQGGRHCAGYAVKQRKRAPSPDQICWDSQQVTHRQPPRIRVQFDLNSLDFQDTTGMLYFREFVDLMQGPWTTAASSGDLWAVILPQLARNSSTLRYAGMAVGALSVWCRKSTYRSLRAVSVPALPLTEGDSHYFHAVGYYCQSLKLQSQRASVQDALFLSVLLLFFEILRGNRKAALDHVNHGLALLLGLLADEDAHLSIADLSPNPKPLVSAVADVFGHLASQARSVLRDRVGQAPPLPNLAKALTNRKETMESFMVRLSQVPPSSVPSYHIPATFNSLDEFEECWNIIRRRQASMAPIMVEAMQASGVKGSKDEGLIQNFYLELLGNPRIREFCENSRKGLEALNNAFLPLFNRVMMFDTDSPTYLRAIHLRLQFLGVYVFEDTPQFIDVETVQSRTPLFREYLDLARTALRTAEQQIKNPAGQLSLHCGLAWYLLILAFFCRDPVARDEAVWILQNYPGQDGLWNTPALYALALRNRVVERINATDGTPAEQWRRLWHREFVFEDGGERIVLRYLNKDEASGKWQLVEELGEIRAGSEDVQWKRQPLTGSGGLLMTDLYIA